MWGAIWILALPVLFQQFMTACVGLVDKVLGGSLPSEIALPALDGISVGSFVGWFIAIALSGLGTGAQAIIARATGSGNTETSQRAVGTALSLAFVWGGIVGVALYFGIGPLCTLVQLDPAATHFAKVYIEILAFSMPFCSVMMVGTMCLHGAGDTIMPAAIAILTNIVNVAASWVLSGVEIRLSDGRLANPSPIDPLEWGVQGIAAGTSIAWVVGAIAVVFVLLRGVKDLRLQRRRLLPERSIAYRIIRVGIPSFFEGISMWLANFLVLRFIGDIAVGSAKNAAAHEGLQGSHIIAIQWEAFSFLPGFAMGTAAGALAGQYLGAGNPSLAKRSIIACTGVAILIMGTLGACFMLFGEALTAFISDQPAHLEVVPQLLFICGAMQIFFAISMVVRQSLRGVGDTKWAFAITTVSSYAIRLPLAWYLGVYLGMGLPGIWFGLCSEIVVRAALFGARFLNGGWTRITV